MAQHAAPGRRRRSTLALTAVGVTLAATSLSAAGAGTAYASSHREAPLISADPQHDNTDTYAFVSPDKPDTVTLIANWIPFQEPNGGPNYYPWAAGSHYDINIDSDGDGRPDLTYRWVFRNIDARGAAQHGDAAGGTFLYNDGVVNHLSDKTLLFRQKYDVYEIRGDESRTIVHDATAAPSKVGRKSMPDYEQLRREATAHVAGGGTTVATQAADPFFLDLRVFDLLYGGDLSETGQNTLAGYNVNSVVLQVPKSALALRGDAKRNPVIGVWSTTEKQTLRLKPGTAKSRGRFVQVSRLGNPLVNEVVIPANLKDAFNALTPDRDHTVAAAVQKVRDPELARLIESIYGIAAPARPRDDLVEIFLTGICKACGPIKADLNSQLLNLDGKKGKAFVPAEELRLNMSVPPAVSPSRLGVLGKDLAGFPNGRRLDDDVVDIEILAVEGTAQSGKIPPALAGGDGVNVAASPAGTSFPYLALPNTAAVNTAGAGTSGTASGAGIGGGTSPADRSPALPLSVGVLGLALTAGGVLALGRRAREHGAPAPVTQP